MEQYLKPQQIPRIYIPAYGLWLLTAALSILVFIATRDMILSIYTRFFPWESLNVLLGKGSLSLVNVFVSFPLAMLVIAIIIGGFEYQYRYMGKPEAWWILARTLAAEMGILLLAFYI